MNASPCASFMSMNCKETGFIGTSVERVERVERQPVQWKQPLRAPRLRNGQFLGRGAQKTVHAEIRDATTVAVMKSQTHDLTLEATLMMRVSRQSPHRHVMRLIAIEYDALSRVSMVAPIASFGSMLDLVDHLDFLGLDVTPLHKQEALGQVVGAVSHLNSIGIDHGDLAARNVLVFAYKPSDPQATHVRLGDFGNAKRGQTASVALWALARELSRL